MTWTPPTYEELHNRPASYCYEALIRGKWIEQQRFSGESRDLADNKAIERLQHSFNGQVKAIRRADRGKEIIWRRQSASPTKEAPWPAPAQ